MSNPTFKEHMQGLLRMNKSLVFVQDKATAKQVLHIAYDVGTPCVIHTNSEQASAFEGVNKNFAVIAVVPALTRFWTSTAEQVVWITSDVTIQDLDLYEQAIARAPQAKDLTVVLGGPT